MHYPHNRNGGYIFCLKISACFSKTFIHYLDMIFARALLICVMLPKTPSLQWNNCLCTLWTYSHFLELYFPILIRQLFQISTACQKIKKKVLFYSQCDWDFCPNWSGSSVPEAGYSHDEVRQPCLYFKDSEGVFCYLYKNKANVSCLIAATGWVILPKLDPNRWVSCPCDLKIRFSSGVTMNFDGWPWKQ